MWTSQRFAIFVAIIVSVFFISGCLVTPDVGTESGSTVVSAPNSNLPFPEKTVCDPFDTTSPQARDQGLAGKLFYLSDDQPRYKDMTDFFTNAQVADVNIFLDRLFIPNLPFKGSFHTQAGSLVTTTDGSPLSKYFGMQMESQLQLAPGEPAGYYQLAVIADDGAVLKIADGSGGYKTLVNNNGNHATKMACANDAIYLDQNTRIPIIMQYYQGPRYHVSLVSMWRPWPDGVTNTDPVNDAYCGRSGNGLFFDSTKNPIKPKEPFYELLSRNWKVLENANYKISDQEVNPCLAPEPPVVPAEEPLVISGFTISNVLRDSATLNWTTNIPSTSQGWYYNATTGVSETTVLDSTLVQTHSLTITGLAPNTLYSVKGLSTTLGGQSITSDELAFKTPR